ncbi:hypothetical protein [Deinococcus rufus]|uniref:Uncharacterized protein n=1 Tax=Deinococcus rufus TaxID=2136097 RepID=A0ABV7Z9V4_9DEIO
MSKTRSPCTLLLTLALGIPPGMTLLQEAADAPPRRPTPEFLRERGVRPGQTDTNVSLHETAMRLTNVRLSEAVEDGRQLTTFKADIAVADVINLNWRYYPRSAYEAANARAARAIEQGKLTALLEHPGWEDAWKGRLDAIAARWTSLGIEDREIEWPPDSGQRVTKPVVFGEGVFIGTPAGDVVRALLAGEVFVGISTNGYSSVEWTRFGDLGIDDPTGLLDPDMEVPVTGDDLTYLTIDFVALPANMGGQTTYAEQGGFAPPPVRPAAPPTEAPPAEPSPVVPPPTPIPPVKEAVMHPKIKALCEQLGKTLDQVKAENATEYQAALEAIAEEQNTLHTEAARVPGMTAEIGRLQQTVRERDERITVLEGNAVRTTREGLVDAAIAAAHLPALEPYQDGDKTVDLQAEWRSTLVESAVAADSDAAAQVLINAAVSRQAHMLAGRAASVPERQQEGARRPNAPRLPQGNNDAPEQLQEGLPGFADDPLVGSLQG